MDADLALVLGVVLLVFAIPAIMSAYSDSRTPRVPAIIVLIAGGLILFAVVSHPGGYSLSQVPDAFANVIGKYIR